MKEEKNQPQVPTTASDDKIDWQVVPIPKVTKPKPTSMEGAIRAGIAAGKRFKLVRKLYQGRNGSYYFTYSVIVMLNNAAVCREIRLTPDIGYVGRDSGKQASSNSASYTYLNLMYDLGTGMYLVCKEEPVYDRYGNETDNTNFSFYARCTDVSGVQQDFLMKASSPGDRSMLLGAFSGFGGVRDWEESDKVSCKPLVALFEGYCAPGCIPSEVYE